MGHTDRQTTDGHQKVAVHSPVWIDAASLIRDTLFVLLVVGGVGSGQSADGLGWVICFSKQTPVGILARATNAY